MTSSIQILSNALFIHYPVIRRPVVWLLTAFWNNLSTESTSTDPTIRCGFELWIWIMKLNLGSSGRYRYHKKEFSVKRKLIRCPLHFDPVRFSYLLNKILSPGSVSLPFIRYETKIIVSSERYFNNYMVRNCFGKN
jgi:hypothetical protein